MSDALSREVDALVAEHVMGATWATPYFIRDDVEVLAFEHPETQRHTSTFVLATRGEKTLFDPWELLPHYSTDIAAAWEVVEKMREDGWFWIVQHAVEVNEVVGQFDRPTEGGAEIIRALAFDAPEAICLAALRAKGVEV